MAENDNELLKKQLKENITDSGIEELIVTKQKLEEKDDIIADLQKKLEEYEELLKRKMADFDNYKKRVTSERDELSAYANQKLVEDILPVIDNFEKAIESAEKNADFNALFDGIKLIEKQFKQILSKYNVEPLVCVGKEFDPNIHDALMIDESGDYDFDTVIKEWLKGYKMSNKVIRHAQVVIGKSKNKFVTEASENKNKTENEKKEINNNKEDDLNRSPSGENGSGNSSQENVNEHIQEQNL